MEIELSDNEETQEFTITVPNGREYAFQVKVSASGNNLDLWLVWPSADDSSYVFVQTGTNAVQVVPE